MNYFTTKLSRTCYNIITEMAKLKAPLFSLSAQGALAKLLTFRRHGPETIAGIPTTHPDAKSPAQLGWRTMYEACSALWHTLSDLEKQAWETNARAKHMTGFALWQSQCLRPNPGIYLPLAGGTMSGDILMATHKITGLPLPTLDPDAATKAYVDAAAAPFDPFAQFLEFIPWLTLDAMLIGGDAGYIIGAYGSNLLIATNTAPDTDAYLTTQDYWYSLLETGKLLTFELIILNLAFITQQNIWLRLTDWWSDPPSETHGHLGWKIDGSRLYASNADDTNQTITDTGIDLNAGPQFTRLKIVSNYGVDIKFYVNNLLVATHTDNLLAWPDQMPHFHVRTLDADSKTINLARILIQKEY